MPFLPISEKIEYRNAKNAHTLAVIISQRFSHFVSVAPEDTHFST